MKFQLRASVLAISFALATPMVMADTIKIAFIDPLSGPFAPVGQNILNSYQYIAEKANAEKWAGDNQIEVVGFDNKGSPQESLAVLKSLSALEDESLAFFWNSPSLDFLAGIVRLQEEVRTTFHDSIKQNILRIGDRSGWESNAGC